MTATGKSAARVTAVMAGAVFALTLLQAYVGVPVVRTVPLEMREAPETEGLAVRARVPESVRSPLTNLRARLLEDGVEVGMREPSRRNIALHGGGRFRVRDHLLWFSSPRHGEGGPWWRGHRYALVVPMPLSPAVPVVAFVALGAAAFAIGRDREVRERATSWRNRLSFLPISTAGVAVVGAAAAVAAVALLENTGVSDSWFMVKGVPFSDALGWHDLGVSLSAGNGIHGGFDGHRPFYGVMLGALYQAAGPELSAARWLNVAAVAAAAGFLFALGVRGVSLAVGLALAGAFMAVPGVLEMLPRPMTELPALALYFAALVALHAGLADRRWLPVLLAGLLCGFANMTQTFTVLTLPLFAALVVLVFSSGGRLRDTWRGAMVAGALFVAGVFAVFFPWMLRQHLVHDTWSISANSASIIYGTVAEEGPGHWHEEQYAELDSAAIPRGTGDESRFFYRRFRETVAADPWGYASLLGTNFVDYFNSMNLDHPRPRAVFVLTGAFMALAAAVRSASVSGLCAFAFTWPVAAGIPLVGAGPATACAVIVGLSVGPARARLMVAVVALSLLGNACMSAAAGNFGLNRLSLPRDTFVFVLILVALWHTTLGAGHALQWLRGRVWHVPPTSAPDEPRRPLALAAAWPMAGLCGLATLMVVIRHVATPAPQTADGTLPPAVEDNVRELVERHGGPDAPEVAPALVVRQVTFADLNAHLDAREDAGHIARPYQVREAARTVALGRAGPEWDALAALEYYEIPAPAGLPNEEAAFAVAAVPSEDANAPFGAGEILWEVVALVPWDPSQDAPDYPAAKVFAPSPHAREAAAANRPAQPEPLTPETPPGPPDR